MSIRIVHAEEKGPLGLLDEPFRFARIVLEFVPTEVRGLHPLEIERKG